jgi:hypothetical protein
VEEELLRVLVVLATGPVVVAHIDRLVPCFRDTQERAAFLNPFDVLLWSFCGAAESRRSK